MIYVDVRYVTSYIMQLHLVSWRREYRGGLGKQSGIDQEVPTYLIHISRPVIVHTNMAAVYLPKYLVFPHSSTFWSLTAARYSLFHRAPGVLGTYLGKVHYLCSKCPCFRVCFRPLGRKHQEHDHCLPTGLLTGCRPWNDWLGASFITHTLHVDRLLRSQQFCSALSR